MPTTPDHQSEFDIRKAKLEQLRAQAIDPFPAVSHRTMQVSDVLAQFDQLSTDTPITLAGRVRLYRSHGKLSFAQIQDASGQMQVVFSHTHGDPVAFQFAEDWLDVGDVINVTGTPFVTKTGEQSLLVTAVQLLTKAIRPLPEKWHGIQDEEERFRKRYLDMLMNPDLREMFLKKATFWQSIRTFLQAEGFLEVETPVLETTPGGADAEPFVTHHNALDIDLYLRISMGELWQKRLMVGGFEKTFEIGRQFRNEGMSPEHLQDYTQMEFYWGYADYEMGMQLVQRLYTHCIQETFSTLQFTIREHSVDFNQPWPQLDYTATVEQQLGINVLDATEAELLAACQKLKLAVDETLGRGRLIDLLWKQCRKQISGPAFVVHHPVEVSPLAKRRVEDTRTVQRFQVIIAGSELGNGYSELNDPIDQHARFQEQAGLREAGDAEAQMHDQEFVEALEYGMPPTCGFGLSERLFSFLMNKPIRECVLFPLLRPKHEGAAPQKSKDTKIAVAIVNTGAGLARWQEMNTVAHLNAEFGAHVGRSLFLQEQIQTSDDKSINLNIQHAILIKQAPSSEVLRELRVQANLADLEIADFTREMLQTTDDKKIITQTKLKSAGEIEYIGLLIFGKKSEVDALTKHLDLFS